MGHCSRIKLVCIIKDPPVAIKTHLLLYTIVNLLGNYQFWQSTGQTGGISSFNFKLEVMKNLQDEVSVCRVQPAKKKARRFDD